MILYEFQCHKCRKVFQRFREIPGYDGMRERCDCGGTASRVWSPAAVKVSFRAGFQPGLDEYVGTEREYDRKLKESGSVKRD